MALSERKKEVLDVKDDTPNAIVQNDEWPNALPVELRRLVISYFFDPLKILEEIETLNKKLSNTMDPFVKAVDKIKPLLGNSIFKKIHDVKDTKYNLQSTLESKGMENIIFEECIKKISHLPVETQIDFLVAVYNGDLDREEKNHTLNRTRKEIKEIYKCGVFTILPFSVKNHTFNIIMTKLNVYICNAYQSSTTDMLRSDGNLFANHHINSIEQMLQHEQTMLGKKNQCAGWFYFIPSVMMIVVFLLTLLTRDNKLESNVIPSFLIISMLSMCLYLFFDFSGDRHRNNTYFLIRARNGLNRVQRENIINAQESKSEAKSLLATDQEADDEANNEQGSRLNYN